MVKKPLIIAAVSLLLVIVAMWGIAGQKRSINSQKAQYRKLTSDLTNLDAILNDEQTYGATIKKVEAALPKEYHDVATAISAIELTARANALITETIIDEHTKPESEGLESLTITVKTSGSYASLAKFASDVAHLPYHTRMDLLSFEQTGGKVSATMTIRLFMQ